MKAYLAIKFYEDCSNRKLIEELSDSLEGAGIETAVMTRDYEDWGKKLLKPMELMELAFKLIDESDVLIIDLSEKGVGLGIEAGYAYAKNIPIVVIAKSGSHISDTLRGIVENVIFYSEPKELTQKFKDLKI